MINPGIALITESSSDIHQCLAQGLGAASDRRVRNIEAALPLNDARTAH